ncbi:MAG TPA: ISL3 family transposase [Kofleriaceae bacterium]|nr:ISL3 family transposase [Kofleriaceae bacterium]
MRDRDLYAKILGIEAPWKVVDVELSLKGGDVTVRVEHEGKKLRCPECGAESGRYDARERRWRHLDTCQYRTILVAKVPRVSCEAHGVRQVEVPWAEVGSRFTAMFEALVIDWLKETTVSAVARRMDLSWDEAGGIMDRAVARGLARRELALPTRLGVDETAFQKRHEYVTVVNDLEGRVVHVADGRGKDTLAAFYRQFDADALDAVEVVAMDMWPAYINATREHVPDADKKIAFDKFHVAQHLGDAVDKVRREEHQALLPHDDDRLKGTKYLWLRHPDKLSEAAWAAFANLRESALKTARAWAIKESAMMLWSYRSRAFAARAWRRWYGWAIRSRLAPIKRVARMVKAHLDGIITAIIKNVTNARAEGLNAAIQRLKYNARGYRNRQRFRNAIYFHLGGLDLYPRPLSP